LRIIVRARPDDRVRDIMDLFVDKVRKNDERKPERGQGDARNWSHLTELKVTEYPHPTVRWKEAELCWVLQQ